MSEPARRTVQEEPKGRRKQRRERVRMRWEKLAPSRSLESWRSPAEVAGICWRGTHKHRCPQQAGAGGRRCHHQGAPRSRGV